MYVGNAKAEEGGVIAEFDETKGEFLVPRGRYHLELYESHLRMYGNTYDFKIKYSDVVNFFLLPMPDDLFSSLVMQLTKPIRQGHQEHPNLVLQMSSTDRSEVGINLSEEDLASKYNSDMQMSMTGTQSNLVCKVFKVMTGKKVFVPGKFLNAKKHPSIACSLETSAGHLYPLERVFIFLHEPPVLIPFGDVESVEFRRSVKGESGDATTSTFFDLAVNVEAAATHQGAAEEYVFAGIDEKEFKNLRDFIQGKPLRMIVNISVCERTTSTSPLSEAEALYSGVAPPSDFALSPSAPFSASRASKEELTPLHIACAKGDVDVVELLLETGASIDQATITGMTPLHIACDNGTREVVELLLERGASMDQASNDGLTPLHFASLMGREQCVTTLLAHGADATRGPTGNCPVILATKAGHKGIAVRIQVHLAIKEKRRQAALAAEAAEQELLEELDGAGKEEEKTGENSLLPPFSTILPHCLTSSSLPAAARTTGRSALGRSDSTRASSSAMDVGNAEAEEGDVIAEFDETKGEFLVPRGRYHLELYESHLRMYGNTYDFKIKYSDVVNFFLLPMPDDLFSSLVMQLTKPIRQGHQEHPNLVLQMSSTDRSEVGINLSEEDLASKYNSDMQMSMTGTQSNLVCKVFKVMTGKKVFVPGKFLNAKKHPSIACSLETSAGHLYPLERVFIFLHEPPVLIPFGDVESVEFRRSVKGESGDATTSTFFDLAVNVEAAATHQGAAEEYVFAGIDEKEFKNLRDFIQGKPLRMIVNISVCERTTSTSPLSEAEALYSGVAPPSDFALSPSAPFSASRASKEELTPLHIACAKGDVDVVELLLETGASIDQATITGMTPLHIACDNGTREVVELLLERGASMDQASNDGLTPLHFASLMGREQCVTTLLAHGADATRGPTGNCPVILATKAGHKGIAVRIQVHLAIKEKRRQAALAAEAAEQELLEELDGAGKEEEKTGEKKSKSAKKKEKKSKQKQQKRAGGDLAQSAPPPHAVLQQQSSHSPSGAEAPPPPHEAIVNDVVSSSSFAPLSLLPRAPLDAAEELSANAYLASIGIAVESANSSDAVPVGSDQSDAASSTEAVLVDGLRGDESEDDEGEGDESEEDEAVAAAAAAVAATTKKIEENTKQLEQDKKALEQATAAAATRKFNKSIDRAMAREKKTWSTSI